MVSVSPLRSMPHGTEVSPPTILVVDDNEANRSLARHTLEDEGYRVIVATGGAEAIAAFERGFARFWASKLGYDVSKDTVAKYMPKPAGRPRRPPSQSGRLSSAIISRVRSRSIS